MIVGDTICRKVDKIEDRINAGLDSLNNKIDVGGAMLVAKVGEISAKLDAVPDTVAMIKAKFRERKKIFAQLDALEAKVDAMHATLNMVVVLMLWMIAGFALYFRPSFLQQPHETSGWASYVEDRSDLGIMWDGFVCFCDFVFVMPTDE